MKKLVKQISDYLNRKTVNWTTRKKRIFWLTFMLISASLCGYSVIKPFLGPSGHLSKLRKAISVSGRMEPYSDDQGKQILRKITQYKHYLDSLAACDTSQYQAILRSNPHILENIYSIQSFFSKLIKK